MYARVAVLLVLVTIFTQSYLLIVEANSRSLFGEPCNSSSRCKSKSWLTCDPEKGLCLCQNPDMIWNTTQEKCLALLGEKCMFKINRDSKEFFYEKADCVSLAKCNGKTEMCECPETLYPSNDSMTCLQKKGFSSNCKSNQECLSPLQCRNGTCLCEPTKVYGKSSYKAKLNSDPYHYKYYKYEPYYIVTVSSPACGSAVDGKCRYYPYGIGLEYCVKNAYCKNNASCACEDGFNRTAANLCGVPYGKPCTEGDVCFDNLQCIQGTCSCRNPSFQSFEDGACKNLAGAECADTKECVGGAICERTNFWGGKSRRCECGEGYVEGEDQRCYQTYGSECSYSDAAHEKCDPVAGLVCKNGKCLCENEVAIYEGERRQCSIPIGYPCKQGRECVENSLCWVRPEKSEYFFKMNKGF